MEFFEEDKQPDLNSFNYPRIDNKPVAGKNESTEKAFYAASQFSDKEDPAEDFRMAKNDLEIDGHSSFVAAAEKEWEAEQTEENRKVLVDILHDPSIPDEHKKNLVYSSAAGGLTTRTMRDRYIVHTAAEDLATTAKDRNTVDILIDDLQNRDKAAESVQDEINSFGKNLNPSAVEAVAGVFKDIILLGHGGFVDAKVKEALMPGNGATFVKDAILRGNTRQAIADAYAAASPEQQREMVKTIAGTLRDTWNFDYNRYEAFTSMVDSADTHWAFRRLEDVVGLLDAFGLGKILKNPIKELKYLTTVEPVFKNAPRPNPVRMDPTLKKEYNASAPNPPTGKAEDAPIVKGEPSPEITNAALPQVPPMSPMGTTGTANTIKTAQLADAALKEPTDEVAQAMGTTKGEIFGTHILPKMDYNIEITHADIADKLARLEVEHAALMKEVEVDPSFVNVTQREADKEIMMRAFAENKGGYYQQANSTMINSLDKIYGTAVYGRNSNFGWDTAEEATRAMEDIKEIADASITASLRTAKRNGQWYVEHDYAKQYDPFSGFLFGHDTASARIDIPGTKIGFDATKIAQSGLGKWVWDADKRLSPWISQKAFRATTKAHRIEAEYLKIIDKEIAATPHKKELFQELSRVQEGGEWDNYAGLATRNAHLNDKELKQLYSSYLHSRKMFDFDYEWANKFDRGTRESKGQKAIRDSEGNHLAYGTPISEDIALRDVKFVYDMDADAIIPMPKELGGRTVVVLDEPIKRTSDEISHLYKSENNPTGKAVKELTDDNIFTYAIAGGKSTIHSLPYNTLHRIPGYISRRNIENWYVMKIPTGARVNGDFISDPKALADYSKVIGAAKNEKDAKRLVERFKQEHPGYTIAYRKERGDTGDAILTDHKVYKEILDHSMKRGERLPTIDGLARLEDPLPSIVRSLRSGVRLNAWQNYQEVFQKNFTRMFGEFLEKGEFPNVITDLRPPKVQTPEAIAEYKTAQRLFEQYANQQYKVTTGDALWKDLFSWLGDTLEKPGLQALSELSREVGKQGNLLVRTPKALGSSLFLHLNPLKQLVVQPSNLYEWSVMSPSFTKHIFSTVPALELAVLSKASMLGEQGGALYKVAQKMAGMDSKEFDAVFKAVYSEGVPQSVDLNLMLQGGFVDATRALSASGLRTAAGNTVETIKTPAKIGRLAGYTPAEMANSIGTWLYARHRWIANNPGKDWNTPNNIAQITEDYSSLSKMMATRAGAMPYSDGAVSLMFQFFQHQHKSFMELFSSKTMSSAEKGKLAAARMVLWGAEGTIAYNVIDLIVDGLTTPQEHAEFSNWTRGLVDTVNNRLIDTFLSEPGSRPSNLSFSDQMSPMPNTLPYLDFMIALSDWYNDKTPNPRFPFIGALGAVGDASRDISRLFAYNEYETIPSLMSAWNEAAEMTSGYNNFVKGMMIKELGDKSDKLGRGTGLDYLWTDAAFQFAGITTKDELYLHKITESSFERQKFIKDQAKQMQVDMQKFEGRYGSPDHREYNRRVELLNSFLPKETVQDIKNEFYSLERKALTDKKTSVILGITNAIKTGVYDKYTQDMLKYLEQSTDPDMMEFNKRIKESILNKEGLQ